MEQAYSYYSSYNFYFKEPSSKASSVQWYLNTKSNIDCKCGADIPASECLDDSITENTEETRAYCKKDFSTLLRIFMFKLGKLCNSRSEIMILSKHAAILTFHVSFQHSTMQ